VKYFTNPDFWNHYEKLPKLIQGIADKNFKLLKTDPHHPSLKLKKVNEFFSVRIGLKYRALGIGVPEGILWFWIGKHSEYDKLIETSPVPRGAH
jgi:hypothetical protein